MEFHEAASTVMMNSLKTQPRNSFLKQLYTRLFFVPIWIDEDSVSYFSKELFRQITEDRTLDTSSKIYQDAIRLEQKAQDVYASNAT
ncbi:murein L,D-transpeptidase, partial [Campylobacterota bacterium]